MSLLSNAIKPITRLSGMVDPKVELYPTLIGSTNTSTNAVSVPAGVLEGDVLICFAARRNSTTYGTPVGWTRILHQDASSNEWNHAYTHVCTNSEPASYTFTFNGYSSYVCAAFRNLTDTVYTSTWNSNVFYAQQRACARGCVYFGVAFDAYSSQHVYNIYGLTKIANNTNANTSVYVGYQICYAADNYGPYYARSTTASYDGMAAIVLQGLLCSPVY